MILTSLPNVNAICARRSIVVYFIKFQCLLVLCTIKMSLSFPMESFVYETNPVQKLSIQYNQDGSTRPIRFKLQAISFKINEQLPTLDAYQDSMQEPAKNTYLIKNATKINEKEELQELEKKFHTLSRFTVFYNTPEREVSNNVTNKDIQQIKSTSEDQTETVGSNSDNNTNTNDSITADQMANSVHGTNLGSEDETTESKLDQSEYQIITEGVSVHDVTVSNNVNNKDIQQVKLTSEDQTETEGLDSENNTNINDSITADREINAKSVNKINLGSEIEPTESKLDQSEYQIVTERVSVQDVTEPVITTETMLETGDTPTESYENLEKEAKNIKPIENNESEVKYYEFTREINNDKNIDRHQTTESITIEDLQTDIYDNTSTTEGYTQTDEYEESGNITESENHTTNSSEYY